MNWWQLLMTSGLLSMPIGFLAISSGLNSAFLLLLFSYPHFVFSFLVLRTSRMAYQNKIFWGILLPIFLFSIVFAISSQNSLIPSVLVQVLYFYLLWHFAKQSFGVSLWLQKNHSLGEGFKKSTHFLNLLIAFFAYVISQRGSGSLILFKTYSESINWREDIVHGVLIFTSLSLILWLIYFGFKILQNPSRNRVFALLPTITLFLVFSLSYIDAKFVLLAVLMHGLQYYPFAAHSVKWTKKRLAILLILSLGIFFAPDFIFIANNEKILSVIFITINLHHFMMDTVLWKSNHSQLVRRGYIPSI